MGSPTPRKRDGAARRKHLCDAGITVLAEYGSRGLTHQQVDRTAGVPAGTTSYYYRTRDALFRGVGQRVAEIDMANLASLAEHEPPGASPWAFLAELVMMQAHGQGLALNRARQELMLATMRDPELAALAGGPVARVIAMTHDALAAAQPASEDTALREAQSDAVTTFIAGLFSRFAAGDQPVTDAAHLERMLQAIVTAVALAHGEDRDT
ncbi:TetR/AcrR family transcriptional regulator [Mycolicibacterium vaccae]|uniref:TetR/AcrR family transcriptional regulator n=1 Tax=Mycolicibacterium vaccae TaxID=1810 RepID=UPI003CEA81C0